jgi:hypothetical protein
MTGSPQASAADPVRAPSVAPPNLGHEGKPAVLQRIMVPIAACTLAALYLLYVVHFSVNAPLADEWSTVPLVHNALHGHLSLSALWTQHVESRILFPNLIFVAAGFVNHYDVRTIMLLGAAILIASYFLVLVLVRTYLQRRLTVLPTVVLGVVWLSVADVENALWGFQVAWYLVVFLCVAMLYLLLASSLRRPVAFGLAAVAVVIASFSGAQGLLLWPIGLLVVLWTKPRSRGTYVESLIWLVVAAITTGIYLWSFNVHTLGSGCISSTGRCSPFFSLRHLWPLTRFMLALVGNAVPTVRSSTLAAPYPTAGALLAHELLGGVLCVVAGFVVVQSFRERRTNTRMPLPLALIAFGVLFDVLIADGRLTYGLSDALADSYTMPQLVLLAGVVIYAFGHVPSPQVSRVVGWRGRVGVIGYVALLIFVAVQVVVATPYGIYDGRVAQEHAVREGRLLANLSQIPRPERACYEGIVVADGEVSGGVEAALLAPALRDAQEDHVGVFSAGPFRRYRAMGPPVVKRCDSLRNP